MVLWVAMVVFDVRLIHERAFRYAEFQLAVSVLHRLFRIESDFENIRPVPRYSLAVSSTKRGVAK